jgi:hypothetical protein
MPVFIAFAAFVLLLFGQRLGLPMATWVSAPFGNKRKTPGQKSGVRTASLEMVLDHDTGRMEGKCLKGRFANRDLNSLAEGDQIRLLDELRATDAQGALLLEAYLDRRSQGWRDRHPNGSARNEQKQPGHSGTGMTIYEAYEVLGLKSNARIEEIRAAHRRMMMKFHPDQGGSTYFAARINEAKEILLTRK